MKRRPNSKEKNWKCGTSNWSCSRRKWDMEVQERKACLEMDREQQRLFMELVKKHLTN